MSPAEYAHAPAPEEVMAWLDGEGTVAARARIEAHVATCATCQAIASDLRAVSAETTAWTVDEPPLTLRVPDMPPHRAWWAVLVTGTSLRFVTAGAVVLIVAVVFSSDAFKIGNRARQVTLPHAIAVESRPSDLFEANGKVERRDGGRGAVARGGVGGVVGGVADSASLAPSSPQAAPASPQAAPAPRQPMVIRTATLRLVVKDVPRARAETERVITTSGGFADRLTVTGEAGSGQSLQGVIRVPGDKLADVLARLRQLGQILEDGQQSEDVTDQIVDLDTRMANTRATEQRLVQILKERTGKLSDVLEVERELARVRLDIERMDAERTNLGRRVIYAAITIEMTEERKASVNAPLPFATRMRIAAADGIDSAVETLVGALLVVVSAGPTVLIWVVVVGLVALALRRFRFFNRSGLSTPRA